MSELERRQISERVAQARKEAGLTQQEMADLLGVHKRTVENYENGRVPWDRLGDIAEITGKSRAWLLHGDSVIEDARGLREAIREELGELPRLVDELLHELGRARRSDEAEHS